MATKRVFFLGKLKHPAFLTVYHASLYHGSFFQVGSRVLTWFRRFLLGSSPGLSPRGRSDEQKEPYEPNAVTLCLSFLLCLPSVPKTVFFWALAISI